MSKQELPWVKAQMEESGCQDVLKGHTNYPFQEGLILGRFIPEDEARELWLAAKDRYEAGQDIIKLRAKLAIAVEALEAINADFEENCECGLDPYEIVKLALEKIKK